MPGSICRFCGCRVDGQSAMCVGCFRARLRPCVECMRRNVNGEWRPKWKDRKCLRDTCKVCDGEGWIFSEDSVW